jgi:hypothetical protein
MQDNATPLSDDANETNMVAENNADNQLKMRSKIVKWWEKALDKATTWIANGADNDNEFK